MEIQYLGHSAILLKGSKTVLIDPFLTGNPKAALKAGDVNPDVILVSHGHDDHLGDTVAIAKRSGAITVCGNELAHYLAAQGIETYKMYIGGTYQNGDLTVKMTAAHHGSGIFNEGIPVYLGVATGFIIKMDGQAIYFAGDTGLFYDMKAVIGDLNDLDLAILPIGGTFTMDPEDAAVAAKWLNAKRVLPVHYDTFPGIEQNVNSFKTAVECENPDITVVPLKPGEILSL